MLKTPPPLPPTASLSQLESKLEENKKQETALTKLIDVYYRSHDLTGAADSERELESLKRQNKELELRISAFHAKTPSVQNPDFPSKQKSWDDKLEDLPPPPPPRLDESDVNENTFKDSKQPLNPIWFMYETEEGFPYYYNTETEETFWERPDVPDEEIGCMI